MDQFILKYIYIYMIKVELMTVVMGDPKTCFSIVIQRSFGESGSPFS